MSRTHSIKINYTQKLAQTAGSLSALALLPMSAQAGIIYHSAPLDTVSLGAANPVSVNWDVDGDTTPDFRLWKSAYVYLDSYDVSLSYKLNGRGLVQSAGANPWQVNKLESITGFKVGPILPNGFQFSPDSRSYRTVLSVDTLGNGVVGSNFNSGGFTGGGGEFFGFRFTQNGADLYGWAEIDIDTTNKAVTITRWAYNDIPDGSICVGETSGPGGLCQSSAVPEPATASLVLLGLGAGGLRAWRARKKQAVLET